MALAAGRSRCTNGPMMEETGFEAGRMPVGAVGHVRSYYALTSRQMPYRPPAEGRLVCDVCVIGGGLAGLTAALLLARRGRSVILLESNRLGWAASGRNGGFVSAGFTQSVFSLERQLGLSRARELFRLSMEGVGIVRKLVREAGDDERILNGTGALRLIRHGNLAEFERSNERLVRDYGYLQTFLPGRELGQFVASNRYRAGTLDMNAFHIHPLEYASHVAGLAATAGVALHENSHVGAISKLRSGSFLARTRDASVEAGRLVIATSAHDGPSRRVNSAIIPVATYVAAAQSAKLSQAIRFAGCISDTRVANDYYRIVASPSGPRLLWGGGMSTQGAVPAGIAETMRRAILSVYPQLDDIRIEMAWSGIMGFAVHKMPILCRADDGIYVATAFGGRGLNTTAMAAQLVCEAICDGSDRYRAFAPFGMRNAHGVAGRVAAQIEYWRSGIADRIAEARAGA